MQAHLNVVFVVTRHFKQVDSRCLLPFVLHLIRSLKLLINALLETCLRPVHLIIEVDFVCSCHSIHGENFMYVLPFVWTLSASFRLLIMNVDGSLDVLIGIDEMAQAFQVKLLVCHLLTLILQVFFLIPIHCTKCRLYTHSFLALNQVVAQTITVGVIVYLVDGDFSTGSIPRHISCDVFFLQGAVQFC